MVREKNMVSEKIKVCLWLFGINLFISAFTFGGGYVVVPMIRKYYVFKKKLFEEDELMNMAAIAQSSPGAIAINLSALAGYQVVGIMGVVISSISAVIPPIVILAIVSRWYTVFATNNLVIAILKGMQAGVAALIVDLVIDMTNMVIKERSLLLTLMIPSVFLASFIMNINITVILMVCCGLCIIRVWRNEKRGQK